MKVFAISDLHLDHRENLEALQQLPDHRDDWLIIAGDVGHRVESLRQAIAILGPRFARLIWVPGNHDLWTVSAGGDDPSRELRGEAKYDHLVSLCREHGVLTPEDPYAELRFGETDYVLAPLFTLYDYSYRPADVPLEGAVRWALDSMVLCTDEHYLHPDPHATRGDWCRARCELTERRLERVPHDRRLVLISHFPLREDLIRIRIPRFSIWCGTTITEDWHTRFNVAAVVTGHLHVPRTVSRDGVRFEEVSLGYPRQWRPPRGVEPYLRQILPE